MVAKDSDQRTYFFFLPDETINTLKEWLYLKFKWIVKTFFPSEISDREEDLFSYAKAEIHVKFHVERTALHEFIFLPGSEYYTVIHCVGTLPCNGRSVRILQQLGVHHWSGAGREVSLLRLHRIQTYCICDK